MKRLTKIIIVFLLLFGIQDLYAQREMEAIKRSAITHMRNGRYGEAIDLLNKYISSNAQEAEGYNLRGLSHEKRKIYQFAVLDFRRAIKIEPENAEFRKNLERVIQIWYPLLYQKIEGHEREIAIDPSRPFNYLEIGKSYRWLEEWAIAEIWYDKYLAMYDDASPDDMIRYTEILSHTGSIVKGERWLKKFVGRYPDDWRLWSRYGYFTMWLGNYQNAKNAFTNSLGFKPFFKEAQDGLDLANREGYMVLQTPRSFEKEYPIDRYYRLLRQNPADDEVRFKLTNELLPAERYEEAYDQLKLLKSEHEGTTRYDALLDRVTKLRDNFNRAELDKYLALLKENPLDREVVQKTAEYFARLGLYDEANEILGEYIEMVPDDYDMKIFWAQILAWNEDYEAAALILEELLALDRFNKDAVKKLAEYYAQDYDYDAAIQVLDTFVGYYDENQYPDMRFLLAKFFAWNHAWEDSRDHIEILLANDPENLDYQLLRAQVSIWTVDVDEFPQAEEYLMNILGKEPNNLSALLGMVTIRAWNRQLDEALYYLERAKESHPGNLDIETIENFYNAQVLVEGERQGYEKRIEAGEMMQEGDCEGALEIYENYFAEAESPDKMAKIEFASVYICLERYNEALNIYDAILAEEDNFDIALARAKLHLWMGDSLMAINEFQRLREEDPQNFEVSLFLGDAYLYNGKYGDAEDIYYDLLSETDNEEEIELLNQKIDMIPVYGFQKGFNGFVNFIIPYSLTLRPFADYYQDNQELEFYNFGSSIGFGFARFFQLDAKFHETALYNRAGMSDHLSSFTGHLYFVPASYLTLGGSYGTLNIEGEEKKHIGDLLARYDNRNNFMLTFLYSDNDARRVLPSPRLIGTSLDVYSYTVSSIYKFVNTGFEARLGYNYRKVSDGNKGNDLMLRFGKYFDPKLIFGYEYFFIDYAVQTITYYSPNQFDTHSIWGEWIAYKKDEWDIFVGGKIGYAPRIDYIVSDLYCNAQYEFIDNLYLSGRIGYGNSFRYDTDYQFISAYLNMYWSFY